MAYDPNKRWYVLKPGRKNWTTYAGCLVAAITVLWVSVGMHLEVQRRAKTYNNVITFWNNSVKSIELCSREIYLKQKCFLVTSVSGLRSVAAAFKTAKPYGGRGHVIPILEFEMTVLLSDGTSIHYSGYITEDRQNEVTLFRAERTVEFLRFNIPPPMDLGITIPNWGAWLLQKYRSTPAMSRG